MADINELVEQVSTLTSAMRTQVDAITRLANATAMVVSMLVEEGDGETNHAAQQTFMDGTPCQ